LAIIVYLSNFNSLGAFDGTITNLEEMKTYKEKARHQIVIKKHFLTIAYDS